MLPLLLLPHDYMYLRNNFQLAEHSPLIRKSVVSHQPFLAAGLPKRQILRLALRCHESLTYQLQLPFVRVAMKYRLGLNIMDLYRYISIETCLQAIVDERSGVL